MIVYSGNKASFQRDLINGLIASKVEVLFSSLGIPVGDGTKTPTEDDTINQI